MHAISRADLSASLSNSNASVFARSTAAFLAARPTDWCLCRISANGEVGYGAPVPTAAGRPALEEGRPDRKTCARKTSSAKAAPIRGTRRPPRNAAQTRTFPTFPQYGRNEGGRQLRRPYGITGTSQAPQWKLGPYSVSTTLNLSVMLSTVGISASSNWDKLTMPVLRHFGQRSFSFHWSVIWETLLGASYDSELIDAVQN